MKKSLFKILSLSAFAAFVSTGLFAETAVPGAVENSAPKDLEKIIQADKKVNPGKDEFVVYYYRPDGEYESWGLWTWAIPGGDGGAMWEYTQDWKVIDGVGYMRLPMDGSATGGYKPVSADGTVGLIVRQDSGWIKDCNDDRIWNISNSRKVAIISRDQKTYAAEPYMPSITSATMSSLDIINLTLSGKFGLYPQGDSGFTVTDSTGKKIPVVSVVNTDSSSAADNYTSRVTLKLATNVKISDSLTVTNPSFRGVAKVNNQKLAIQISEKTIPDSDVKLGAEYADGKVSFNLWAPTASSVEVNLYKKDTAEKADYVIKLEKNEGTGVWNGTFSTVNADGFFYDYKVKNSKGTMYCLDPYSKSMGSYDGKGGVCRSAIVDLSSAKANPAGGMDADFVKIAQREDAVIYEVSVRDFTVSPDADVHGIPGTYKAFIEKIPYLKELGITHVQLMPVVNFYNNDESNKTYDGRGVVNNSNYNWGYDPHNYFTPEGWYATDSFDPYCRVRELRELVNECHKAGLGVILDVVYNHMAGTQFLDDIVPGYYFRLTDDGKYKANSGCGNDTATEHSMMKRLVVDSTKYWVQNYKVDGFRFDLMGLMEASSVLDAYNECAKINPSVIFEGEGWKMYNGPAGTFGMDQNYMKKTDNVAVFNDEYRDLIKAGGFNETGLGFITGKPVNTSRLFKNICGSPAANYKCDDPGDNISYLTCHDGLTLHDAIANNCHLDEVNDRNEIVSRIKLGNVIGMTSQGLGFLHAGQERGRTKPNVNKSKNESVNNFVRNSYDSSDDINQIVWTLDPEYQNLLDYTKGLIAIRRNSSAFRLGSAEEVAKRIKQINPVETDSQIISYAIEAKEGTYVVLVNASTKKNAFKTNYYLKNGSVLADANKAGLEPIVQPSGVSIKGKVAVVDPLTAIIIFIK